MTQSAADGSPETPPPHTDGAGELEERGEEASFPVVGVGASAGGLEAITQLLQALPADTGMAFVLVQHLSPAHPSALAEILSRATTMAVSEVHDEPAVEPNHVYVIPPDRSMIIADGVLKLLPREGGIHRPIDQFFRALAEDRRHQAIAIVLSGTATDGTLGLEAVKGEGGITFAQDGTAQHDGMPSSAVASGCVDFVLPPDAIAREIIRISRHPYAVPESVTRTADDQPSVAQIVALLRHATGVDFSHYKWNTLYRRITRRMVFQKVDSLAAYVSLLRQTPAEVEALYQDILISVTSFFRDKESFEALKSQVFPGLLKNRSPHDPVRIWTPGCSTGQEAYSLVMAFTEAAEALGSSTRLQLFATDLNPVSIEKARAGAYPKDIAQDVSPERLRRFFVEADGRYRVSKTIRDACVFSRHNVLTDPPFSHLDLISCRNLLIYLEPVLQQRVIPTLHYALKPSGTLWLGSSETIGGYPNLFEIRDLRHKIYRKKGGGGAAPGHFPLQPGGMPRSAFAPAPARHNEGTDLPREADRLLSTRFAPPGVLVSAELEILQFRGKTDRYLAPAPGKASLGLLRMLREGLVAAVRAAIFRAGSENAPVREEGLRIDSGEGSHDVAIEVIPIKGSGSNEGGYLILFEDAPPTGPAVKALAAEAPRERGSAPVPQDPDTARLARELLATREYLRSLIEQQEAANEELQSANEEIQSANEELQSTNEELETSKEEIQSSNEELTTVNDELNNRNTELSRVNNDLVNLLGSIQTAIVMLGPDLRVRRFTPAAEKLLNLIPSDVGRPLSDIKLSLDGLPDLTPLLLEVLATVTTQEREVRDRHGRWYSLRLRPYRTLDNRIDGVVLMLVDVDAMKRAHAFTESIVATTREPLLVLDDTLRIKAASRAFYEVFGASPEETLGHPLSELGKQRWDIPELRALLEKVLLEDSAFSDYEVKREDGLLGERTMILNARRLLQPSEERPSILLAIEDITERKRAESAIKTRNERLHQLWEAAGVLLSTDDVGAMLRGLLTKIGPPLGVDAYLNYMLDEGGRSLNLVSSNGVPAEAFPAIERLELDGSICGTVALTRLPVAAAHVQQSDEPSTARVKSFGIRAYACNPLVSGSELLGTLSFGSRSKDHFDPDELAFLETISHYVAMAYARLVAQEAVRASEARLTFILASMPQKIFTATPDGAVDYFNPQWMKFTGLSFEQIKGWGWTQLVHPDDLEENTRAWQRAIASGEPFQIEHRVRRADGTYRWHFSRATAMRDEAGRILMWVGSNTDVQDIKHAEIALQDSERRYRRLFEAAKDGILILDFESGKVVQSNPFMSELLGYPHDHFIGKETWEIGLFSDKAASEGAMQALKEKGYLRYEHLPLKARDGREVEVEVVANAYREDLHRVIQCNIRDITQRSHLEAQLKQQAKELSDLHRRKDEFLAMLSHELRNPLAPIANAVKLLGLPPGSQSPMQRQACGIIERQVGQLQHLVDDLLEVSRITSGRVQLRRERVAVSEIVERAVESIRPLITQRREELTVSLPEEPVWLHADAARLHQVVVNLLTNAAKYSNEGGHVTLSVKQEGEVCVLRVSDTGVGIGPELLPHVFELFTQADRTLDRSQGGLGIGLALVQRLTELHGGKVEARSVLGEGSEFTVRLPVAPPDVPPSIQPAPEIEAPAARPLRVLVVDDNVDAALMLSMLLEMQGHEVQTAADGPRALTAALAFKPQVVLLDIGLPGMDGYEVARRIRLEPSLAGVVLVALTGYGRDADRLRSTDAGFDHHLVKPADFAKLKVILTAAAEKAA